MNIPAETLSAAGEPAAAATGPAGNSREERNRQQRAWRISPVNPRNRSRGGPGAAKYGYRP